MAQYDNHQYCINHRYDSKPFSSRVVEVVNAHLDKLRRRATSILDEHSRLRFDDVFADALIRTANDLSLADAPEGAIISRFLALFKGTIVNDSILMRTDPHIFVDFIGNIGKKNEDD